MSILDTFVFPAAAVETPGPSAAADLPEPLGVSTALVPGAPLSASGVVAALPQAGAAPPSAVAKPKSKRGRKRGSVALRAILREAAEDEEEAAAAEEVDPAEARSRRAKAAAEARWSKRRTSTEPAGDALPLVPVSAPPAATGASSEAIAGIPMSRTLMDKLVAADKPWSQQQAMIYKRELDLFINMTNHISATALQVHSGGSSRQTFSRKRRLMAACLVMFRRFRGISALKGIYYTLQATCTDFRALHFLVKEKYDEMALRLRLACTDSLKSMAKEKEELAIAKLLQTTIAYGAVFRANGRNIGVRIPLPSTITSIERTNSECIKAGLLRQQAEVAWCKDAFERCTRLPMADDHGGCGKADWSIFNDNRWLVLFKVVCSLHKEHKCGEVNFTGYKMEKTGLVHSTLSFSFAGVWWKFKRTLKRKIKAKLKCYNYGSCGAGPEANAKRAKFEALFVKGAVDGRIEGARAEARQLHFQNRSRLLNGDLDVTTEVQHFCFGPWCCKNPADTYRQICLLVIDPMQSPRVWNVGKWLGADDAIDWHGEWLGTHGLLREVYYEVMHKEDKDEPDDMPPGPLEPAEESDDEAEGGGDAEGRPAGGCVRGSDAGYAGDVDVEDLPEVVPDATAIERAKTYRSNALKWYSSDPLPRLMQIKQLHSVQQQNTKDFLKQCGTPWYAQEIARRVRGETAEYRSSMLLSGKFTSVVRQKYSRLGTSAEMWHILPESTLTHDHAVSIWRSSSASVAANYELQDVRNRIVPIQALDLANANPLVRKMTASWLIQEFHKSPCKFGYWWRRHMAAYPTLQELTSSALG